MSCNCPRCNQGTGECLYDDIEYLQSTIERLNYEIEHLRSTTASLSATVRLAIEAMETLEDNFGAGSSRGLCEVQTETVQSILGALAVCRKALNTTE